MKQLLSISFITLRALGTGCAWISPSSQTTIDGIKVHGHWTVTVSNPDGTLDAVHEFENALGPNAGQVLTAILLGESASNGFGIHFNLTEPIECLEGGYANTPKEMILTQSNTIENTVTYMRDMTKPDTPLRISASCDVTATTTSEITKVDSIVWVLPNVEKYSGSFAAGVLTTTGADLTPIEIHNGQKVSLNIEISFQ